MNVSELMTRRVFGCRVDDTLATAAGLMWDHDIGCVPVLDGEERVVGMLTDRDICMAAYTRGLCLGDILAGSVMSQHLHACWPDQSLESAEELMRLQRIRRAPVLDKERRLLGIVSLSDLARTAVLQRRRKNGERLTDDVAVTLAAVSAPRTNNPEAAA